jgi:hypothetical protein
MVLAVPVLLLSGYVGSYLALAWLDGQGVISRRIRQSSVFLPVNKYEFSELPGSCEFFAVSIWFQFGGERTLDDCRRTAISIRWKYHEWTRNEVSSETARRD